ncbi:MAG: type II toxin-antitoxin system VapC family toxin [Dehalococcoidia bacterium]|nr:type II toxin-antitoxin system VapC family toxin [Dehalococcoidia bacterium]
MPIFYVDSSAVVKRYLPEQGTDLMNLLLENPSSEDRFYTSFLSVLEVTSALHRSATTRQMVGALVDEILARFRDDFDSLMRLWPLNNELVTASIPVVERHRLRSGDAIHLATALRIASITPGVASIMVSSDQQLLNSAEESGLNVLDPSALGASSKLIRLRAT